MAPVMHTSAGDVAFGSDLQAGGAIQHRFSPYEWNGGTVVAVAGKDYVIIAADKRLAAGYSIKSRNISRLHHLAPRTFLGCGGCHADVMELYRQLGFRAAMYKHTHGTEMSTVAAAQLLSNTLYYKRFFPYYALAVVAGLDSEGKGYVAGYDAIGSYIRSRDGYTANGSAAALCMPILDNLIGTIGVTSGKPVPKREYSASEMVEIIKDAFITIGERDILCGDGVDIVKITADGIETEVFALKAD